MFRSLLALVLFAGPVAAQDAATQARVALALASASAVPVPQAQLADACRCAETGVCTCVPFCQCADSKAAWAKMLSRAAADNLPVVVFAGLPNRTVKDCLTVGYPQWCSSTTCYKNAVIVIRPKPGLAAYPITVLRGDATDAAIRDAGKDKPAGGPLVLRAGEHSHICPQCHYEWSHTSASQGDLASHTCPACHAVLPPPWMPARYGPSLRVSAAPMFSVRCPT